MHRPRKPPHALTLLVAVSLLVALPSCSDGAEGDDAPADGTASGYVIYIAGMSLVPLDFLYHDACDRAYEDFSEELRAIAELRDDPHHALTPVCFSYSPDDPDEYSAADTGRSLEASAEVLDTLIAALRERWHAAGHAADPDILIVAHSLGGAVASVWASSATAEELHPVSLLVTFNSPLRGLDPSQLQYWASQALLVPAAGDLQDPTVVAQMARGTGRLRSAQIGGAEDVLVPAEVAFTEEAWRTYLANCGTLLLGPLDGHTCTLEDPDTLAFVKQAIEARRAE